MTPSVCGIDDRIREEPHGADLHLREIAPRVVVPQRPLQRHPAARPLILRVEGVGADAPAERIIADRQGHLIRHAVVEAVLEVLGVGEGVILLIQERALVPELQALRAQDVGGGRRPVDRHVDVRGPVARPVRQARDVAVGEAASRTLLDHPNQVGRARARHRDAAIPAPVGAAVALEQQRGSSPARSTSPAGPAARTGDTRRFPAPAVALARGVGAAVPPAKYSPSPELRHADTSGATSGAAPPSHGACSSQNTLNLLRGVACTVRRSDRLEYEAA